MKVAMTFFGSFNLTRVSPAFHGWEDHLEKNLVVRVRVVASQ